MAHGFIRKGLFLGFLHYNYKEAKTTHCIAILDPRVWFA